MIFVFYWLVGLAYYQRDLNHPPCYGRCDCQSIQSGRAGRERVLSCIRVVRAGGASLAWPPGVPRPAGQRFPLTGEVNNSDEKTAREKIESKENLFVFKRNERPALKTSHLRYDTRKAWIYSAPTGVKKQCSYEPKSLRIEVRGKNG